MEREDTREKMFRGAPPGISLTKEPGSYPWERPPQMEDPEEVIDFYLERMNKPENLEKIMQALELDFPLKALVEGILTSGVSRGVHTIDMSMIVAPVVHEFLKGQADAIGMEYDEGLTNPDREAENAEIYEKIAMIKEMEKLKAGKEDTESAEVSTEVFETGEENPIPEVEEEEPKPKGLMARRK